MNRRWSTMLAAAVPDVAKGVRAAIVMLVPYALAATLHRPELSWTALGGWLGTLADPGGSRSTRAKTIAAFAVGGAVVVAFDLSLLPWPALATLGLTLVVFIVSLLRATGGNAASLAPSLTVVAAVATSRVRTTPLLDAAGFAVGALAAVVLSSVVWPVWTHLPVRRAVAKVYHELAAYLTAVAGAIGAGAPHDDQRWNALVREHHLGIRTAIEAARAQALASRARREGETRYGSNVRALLGAAETQFPLLTTLVQELEALPPSARSEPAQRLAAIAASDREVERILVASTIRSRPVPRRLHLEAAPRPEPGSAMDSLAARLEALSRDAVTLTHALDEPSDAVQKDEGEQTSTTPVRRGDRVLAFDTLVAALSPRSPFFKHAVRSAAAALVASTVATLISPRHGFWITLTTLVVLQTDAGATIKRASERVAGTVLGSLVAVVITETVHGPIALSAVMVPLSIAAVATRPRSYRLFTFFLTPVFVLLSEQSLGDWWTAAERAGDAVVGGLVALVAGVLVFPSKRVPLPDTLVAMLDALAAYAAAVLGPPVPEEREAAARRASGVAIGTAEASLERFLAEPRRDERQAAGAMLLVTYCRRLEMALTSVYTHAGGSVDDPEAAAYVAAVLADARAKVRDEPRPGAIPPMPVREPDEGPTALARALRWASLVLTASADSR